MNNTELQEADNAVQDEVLAHALWEYKSKGVTVKLERPGFVPPLFGKIEIRDKQWVLIGTHCDEGEVFPFKSARGIWIHPHEFPTVTVFANV